MISVTRPITPISILKNVSTNPELPRNGRTLLVVDDEPGVRLSLSFLLTGEGYKILPADSGRMAIAMFDAEAADGAIIDVHMPGMNGLDTCIALQGRAAGLGRPLRVWFITGAFTRDLERRCLQVGGTSVFPKPFDWSLMPARLAEGFAAPPFPPALPPPRLPVPSWRIRKAETRQEPGRP